MLSQLFRRHFRRTTASRSPRRRIRGFSVQQLEPRKVLAVFYHGINYAVLSGDEPFFYEVSVTQGDTLYARYEAQTELMHFGTSTQLGGGPVFVPGVNAPTHPIGVRRSGSALLIDDRINAGSQFSLPLTATFGDPTTNLGGRTPDDDTFFVAGVRIVGADHATGSTSATSAGALNHSFTLLPGDPLPTKVTLNVELPSTNLTGTGTDRSLITINSAAKGLELAASDVLVNATATGADLRARDRVKISADLAANVSYWSHSPRSVTANAAGVLGRVSDGDFILNAGATITGTMNVRTGFAAAPADRIGGTGAGGDIRIDGTVTSAGNSVFQMNSVVAPRSIRTGPTGSISGTGSITLWNSTLDGGVIDVKTKNFTEHVFYAATPLPNSPTAKIGISINHEGDFTSQSVPASRSGISITATGTVKTTAVVATEAALTIQGNKLDLRQPISTEAGPITLASTQSVTLGSDVRAGIGGVGDLTIQSVSGDVLITSAANVAAVGESIFISAKGNVASEARLIADNVILAAAVNSTSGTISVRSRTRSVTATSRGSIEIEDDDALHVESVLNSAGGNIDIGADEGLTVDNVKIVGAGAISLSAAAGGLIVNDRQSTTEGIFATNGGITLAAGLGNVEVQGGVAVQTNGNIAIASGDGDIVLRPSATISVPSGSLSVSAPQGRVLTPGSLDDVVIEVDGGGSWYETSPNVTFASGTGATAGAVIADQGLTGVRVLEGGSGYTGSVQVQLISRDGNGSNAAAVATVVGGSVTSIAVTNPGQGYTTAPEVRILGTGSGASAIASINGLLEVLPSGPVQVSLQNRGAGYRHATTHVLIDPPPAGGRQAVASAVLGITADSFTISNPGSGYAVNDRLFVTGGNGSGAEIKVTQVNGSGGITGFTVEHPGTGFTGAPTALVRKTGSGSGATISGVDDKFTVVGIALTDPGTGYIANPSVRVVSTRGVAAVDSRPVTGPIDGSKLGVVFSAPDIQGGQRATGTVAVQNGEYVFTMTKAGSGYYDPPTATLTSGVVGVTVAPGAGGQGYSSTTKVTFTANPNDPNAANISAAQGSVVLGLTNDSVTVTPAGVDYENAAIWFAPENSGTAATGALTVNGGQVTGVTINTPGSGYTSLPTFTITSGVSKITVPAGTGGRGYGPDTTVTFSPPGSAPNYPSYVPVIARVAAQGDVLLGVTDQSVRILSGGSNYLVDDTFTISHDGTTIATLRVTAVDSSNGSAITAFVVNFDPAVHTGILAADIDPSDLTIAPAGASGTGATFAFNGTDFTIVGIDVTNPGGGYIAPPTITITPPGLASANVTTGGRGYSSQAGVSFVQAGAQPAAGTVSLGITKESIALYGGSGFQVGDLLQIVNNDVGGRSAVVKITAVNSGAIANFSVDDPGSGFETAPSGFVRLTGSGDVLTTGFVGNAGNFQVVGVTVTDPGAGFTSSPMGQVEAGISGVSLTSPGAGYSPQTASLVFASPPAGGTTATGIALLALTRASFAISNPGTGYAGSEKFTVTYRGVPVATLEVTNVTGTGEVADFSVTRIGPGLPADDIDLSRFAVVAPGGNGSAVLAISSLDFFEIAAVKVTNAGHGYSSAPTVTFGNPGIANVVVSNGGTNYDATVGVVLTPPPTGGVPATGTAQVSGGVITGITITDPGSGYTNAPTVTFTSGVTATSPIAVTSGGINFSQFSAGVIFTAPSGGGVTATGTVTVTAGAITAINIINRGSGYTSAPTVTFTSGLTGLSVLPVGGSGYSGTTGITFSAPQTSGTTATGTVSLGLTQQSLTVSGGTGYVLNDVLNVTGGGGTGGQIRVTGVSGTGAITSFSILSRGSGYTTAPNQLTGGSGTGATITGNATNFCIVGVSITTAGSGYTSAPTVTFRNHGSGAGAVITPTVGTSAVSPTIAIGSGATATANLTGIAGVAVAAGGSNFSQSSAGVIFTDPSVGGVTATGTVTVTGDAITAINITDPGSGYTSAPTVTFTSGLTGLSVDPVGGSGYSGTTGITFSAPQTSGTTATGTVSLGLTQQSLTLSGGGASYAVGNILTVTGGGGTGGQIEVIAVDGAGAITNFSLLNPGSGYTTAPTGLTGGSGTGATITGNATNFCIVDVTITNPGSGYTSAPTVTFTNAGGGTGAVITPTVGSGSFATVRFRTTAAADAILGSGAGVTGVRGTPATLGVSGIVAVVGSGANVATNASNFTIVGVTVTDPGDGYTVAPSIAFAGPPGANAVATALIDTSRVFSATLQPPTGSGATATATVAVGGFGYLIPPQVVVISSGVGATTGAVSVDADGKITAIHVAAPGGSFLAAPSVSIVDSSNAGFGAAATAILDRGIVSPTVQTGGFGYDAQTKVTLDGPAGAGVAATGVVSLGLTVNSLVQPLVGQPTGSTYRNGDLLAVVAGSGAEIRIDAVNGSGTITQYTVLDGGFNYATTNPAIGEVATTTRGSLYFGDEDVTLAAQPGASGTGADGTLRFGLTAASVSAVNDDAGMGTGYKVGDILTVGGNAAIRATVRVTAENGGKITGLALETPGSGYTTAGIALNPYVPLIGGSGTNGRVQLIGGSLQVVGIDVLAAGSSYDLEPIVKVDAPRSAGLISGNLTITGTGQKFKVGDVFTLTGGSPTKAAQIQVTKITNVSTTGFGDIDNTGATFGWRLINPGYGFTGAPTSVASPPSGAVMTVTYTGTFRGPGATATNWVAQGFTRSNVLYLDGGGGTGAEFVVDRLINPRLGTIDAQFSVGNVVQGLELRAGGTGYTAGTILRHVGGSGAILRANTGGTGTIQSFDLVAAGSGYRTAPSGLAGGSGINAYLLFNDSNYQVVGVDILDPGKGYAANTSLSTSSTTPGSRITITSGITGLSVDPVGGSGYSGTTGITFSAPQTLGTTATGTVSLGLTQQSLTVNAGGTSYVVGNVLNVAGGGGTGGQILVTGVSGTGAITSFSILNRGSGYTTAPTGLTGGSGSGATITGNATNFCIVDVTITNPGSGYTSAPTVTFTNHGSGTGAELAFGFGASVSATATQFVSSIQVTSGGQDYNPATTSVSLVPVSGGGDAFSGPITVNGIGEITKIHVATPGSGYVAPPTVSIVDASGAGSGAVAVSHLTGGVTRIDLQHGGAGYLANTAVTIAPPQSGGGVAATARVIVGDHDGLLGVIQRIEIITHGSGYAPGESPAVTLGGSPSQPASAIARVTQVVDRIELISRGIGYNPTTTTVTLSPVGTDARAQANVDGILITEYVLTDSGSGYSPLTPPLVTVVPWGELGAGKAEIGSGEVTGLELQNAGSGYASAPTVVIVEGTGARFRVLSIGSSGELLQVQIDGAGSGYVDQGHILLAGGALLQVTTDPTGAVTAAAIIRPGTGYTLNAMVSHTRASNGAAAAYEPILLAGKITGFRRLSTGSGYTSTPRVTIQPAAGDSGTGGVATALVSGVKRVIITNPGFDYALPPLVQFGSPPAGGSTAQATARLSGVVSISATSINWVAEEQPLDAIVEQFNTIGVELTAAGNLSLRRASGDLVVTNAKTFDGAINIEAAKVRLTGSVVAGDANSSRTEDVAVTATSDDIVVDASITAPDTITLKAIAGKVTSNLSTLPLLSATNLVLQASNESKVRTQIQTLSATMTGPDQGLSVAEFDALAIDTLVTDGGGVVVAVGGKLEVGSISTTGIPTPGQEYRGSVSLDATRIVERGLASPTVAEVKSGTVKFNATIAEVALQTDADHIFVSKATEITLDNVGARFSKLEDVNASNNILITATQGLQVVQVISAAGEIELVAADGDIELSGEVRASQTRVKLTATKGSISTLAPGEGVVAAEGVLTATSGEIDADLNVIDVVATAKHDVVLREKNTVTLKNVTSTDGDVTVTAGAAILATSVSAGNGDISLETKSGNIDIGSILASSSNGTISIKAAGAIVHTSANRLQAHTAKLEATTTSLNVKTNVAKIEAKAATTITVDESDAIDIIRLDAGSKAAITLTVGGNLTQSGAITGAAMTVTNTAGTVILANAGNSVGSLAVANTGRNVTFTNAKALDVATAGIQGGAVVLDTKGGLTQSGAITGTSLAVTNTDSGAVVLASAANSVGSLAVANTGQNVTFTNAKALDVATAGIQGDAVVLDTKGGLTQSGAITGTSLAVTNTDSGAVVLASAANSVGSLAVANASRDVTFTNAAALDVATAGIQGKAIVLDTKGGLTQSGAITGTSLAVTNTVSGNVVLANVANNVGSLAVANAGRDVTFKNAAALEIAAPGLSGGNVTVTSAGTLTVNQNLVAGTALQNDGDVYLASQSGDIVLNATVSALADRVTLEAKNGTILQQSGKIDTRVLVWFSKTQPSLSQANTNVIEGPNLTLGSLTRDFGNVDITIAGASAPGGVTLLGKSLTIIDLVAATDPGALIDLKATGGAIHFTEAGRVENAQGSVNLTATGEIKAFNRKAHTTVSAGTGGGAGVLRLSATDVELSTAVQTLDATISGTGGLLIAEADAITLGSVNPVTTAGGPINIATANGTIVVAKNLSAGTGSSVTLKAGGTGGINGTGLVTAATVDLDAATGIGTSNALSLAATTISADTTNGTIDIDNFLASVVTVSSLTTGTGSVTFDQTGGGVATFMTVTTANGLVDLEVTSGNLTVSNAVTAGGAGSVLLKTTTSGNILLTGTTTADGDTVTVISAGGINGTGVITANSLAVVATNGVSVNTDIATIDAAVSDVGDLIVTNKRALTIAGSGPISTRNGSATFTVAGPAIVANNTAARGPGADLTIQATRITLNADVSADDQVILIVNPGPIDGSGRVQASAFTITTNGNVTVGAPIVVTSLHIVGDGGIIVVDNPLNEVQFLSIRNTAGGAPNGAPAGSVTYRDATGVELLGATAGAIAIMAGGAVAQSGAIVANNFDLATSAGTVNLSHPLNDVGTISLLNAERSITYVDVSSIAVAAAGIRGGSVAITAGGDITQSGPVAASSLNIVNSAGVVSLGTLANPVGSVAIANAGRPVAFRAAGAVGIDVAGIQGSNVAVTASGDITQAGTISASSLDIKNAAGVVSLGTLANPVGSVAIANAGRTVEFRAAGGLGIAAAGIQAGSLVLATGGNVTQSGVIAAAAVVLTTTGAGDVDLRATGNAFTTLDVTIGAATLSLANTSALTINAAESLNIGSAIVSGDVRVNTPGDLIVSPIDDGLLRSSTQLDLRGVQGDIRLVKRGRIDAPQILANGRSPIEVGGNIASPEELKAVVDHVNRLPSITGVIYEIIVSTSMTLAERLSFARPVHLTASAPGVTLSGSSVVRDGVVLNADASGSRITNLAFAGFSGTAVRLIAAKDVAISGIRVSGTGSGTGLWISGDNSRSSVRASRFTNVETGIRLGENRTLGASGVVLGGRDAADRNVIEGARRAGVFATGFCTGTQLVGMAFTASPSTRVRFDARGSRGLRIIGTFVERTSESRAVTVPRQISVGSR